MENLFIWSFWPWYLTSMYIMTQPKDVGMLKKTICVSIVMISLIIWLISIVFILTVCL